MAAHSYISDGFNAIDLIKLIENTPMLWYTHHANYNNKQQRLKAWESIAAKLVHNWEYLSENDRSGSLAEIKSKWKNIKDTYTRYLKLKNKLKTKKRKYIYADQLHFLNLNPDSIFDASSWKTQEEEESKSDGKIAPTKEEMIDSNEDVNSNSDVQASSDSDDDNETRPRMQNILFVDDTVCSDTGDSRNKGRSFLNASPRNNLTDISINENLEIGEDADKMFLLSLAPLFKNLNEHDKIVARIQLTQVLQRLLYPKKN